MTITSASASALARPDQLLLKSRAGAAGSNPNAAAARPRGEANAKGGSGVTPLPGGNLDSAGQGLNVNPGGNSANAKGSSGITPLTGYNPAVLYAPQKPNLNDGQSPNANGEVTIQPFFGNPAVLGAPQKPNLNDGQSPNAKGDAPTTPLFGGDPTSIGMTDRPNANDRHKANAKGDVDRPNARPDDPRLTRLRNATADVEAMFWRDLMASARGASSAERTPMEAFAQEGLERGVAEAVARRKSAGIGEMLYRELSQPLLADARGAGAITQPNINVQS